MKGTRWLQRLENYKQAVANINEIYDCIQKNGLGKIYIMALIQAFEIVFEQAWKTVKDYLEYQGIKTDTPREAIKTAFLRNLISNGELWIEMMESRNKTSHTYNENYAKMIADEVINKFLPEINSLERTLIGKADG